MFTIEYYTLKNGKSPTSGFLCNMNKKLRAKAFTYIELLEDLGHKMEMPYSKHIKNGIFELRVQQSSNTLRIFYFFYVGNKIVLTNGFLKKTQKTPPAEIEKALKYKADYEERNKK